MGRPRELPAALAFILALAAGCSNSGIFQCSDDGDCGGEGRCEANAYCSFPDASCSSGYRFGVHAPEFIAKQCVEAQDSGTGSTGGVLETSAAATGTGTGTAGASTDAVPGCGNGAVDPEEDCDGDVGTATCESLGFPGGELECDAQCRFDVSACVSCGDGIKDEGEECDGADFGGESCVSLGYFAGDLACAADCSEVDALACTNCGNEIIDPGEVCDGTGLNCQELGYSEPGVSACADDCSSFDVSRCGPLVCGNDPLETDGDCPPQCATCAGMTCTIDCDGSATCRDDSIECPPGWPCEVSCVGDAACRDATITCPPYHSCVVDCSLEEACRGATIGCGVAGTCTISCDASLDVCRDTSVSCGGDRCSASCVGGDVDLVCGSSCDCNPC